MQALQMVLGRHTAVIVPLRREGRPASRRRADDGGFTLIEVLVVVVIIAVLATLVAPNIFQHVGEARRTTAMAQIEMLGAALDAYRLDIGSYPTTTQGLGALWEQPSTAATRWRGPYLRRAIPLDPWGNPYVYRSPGERESRPYELISFGADGRAGGNGDAEDLTSW